MECPERSNGNDGQERPTDVPGDTAQWLTPS
jgi:hypothetical protein